jgi:hypothetical protein
MQKLECDSVAKLKIKLKFLHTSAIGNLRDFYRWSFQFGKPQDTRCLSVELAIGLFDLIFANIVHPHAAFFIEFLKHRSGDQVKPLKVLNKDQWYSFWDFSKSCSEDLEDYDPNGSWPVNGDVRG